jgi:two-component system nitrogen regulation response regulator GlnG
MTANKPTILVIDDDSEIRYSLARVLSSRDYAVATVASGEEGLTAVRNGPPDVIFLDVRLGGMSGIETLQHIRSLNPHQLVILMTAFGTAQTAIEAMKYGAFDYIMKPFDPQKVLTLAETALQTRADLRAAGDYRPSLNTDDYKEGIVGSSPAMQEVFKTIGQVTASDVTVMITGESGTGKELVARGIFRHSHRAARPFIAVNCAAIPDNLIESELFGHEKGSFLDEIGDMALATQTKILRVLQEGEIQRVGGTETLKVNVRVIAATNKDLEAIVKARTFREDLYYRLNVVRIRLPPLRERMEDIPQIVDYLLQTLEKQKKARVKKVSAEAMAVLQRHRWPGNVRELENAIYRSAVIAQGDTILLKDLPPEIRDAAGGAAAPVLPPSATPAVAAPAPERAPPPVTPAVAVAAPTPVAAPSAPPTVPVKPPAASPPVPALPSLTVKEALDYVYAQLKAEDQEPVLERLEREMIARVLADVHGNLVRASERLGMTRTTLRKRIAALKLKI